MLTAKTTVPISLLILIAIHASLFVMAPTLSTKLVSAPFGLHILGGMIVMVFANGLLDVVNQVWGVSQARKAAVAAMVARAVVYLFGSLVVFLPGKAAPGFEKIAVESLRIFLAGEATHLLFQVVVDASLFDWIRRRLRRGFWLRYNLSNLVSTTLTSLFFVTLAHAGTGKPVWSVWAGGLLMRYSVSVALTPILALLVAYLQRRTECEA